MTTITRQTATTLFLALALFVGAGVAVAQQSQPGGKTYKWVDEKGVVHYSDKAPLEAVNREQTVLDKQARAVKKIEATLPENQRKLSDEEIEKQRQEQVQKEIAERKDRALLSSYLKEEDLDLARDRALSTLDAQIEATKLVLAQQQTRRKELLERQERGNALPAGELENLESEIAVRNASIDRSRREKETIYAKYERDKQRWRELKEAERARIEAEKQANKK
ncbi:MAG: DUF4124 domain-containing protein [Proteobacteria bacterium]|nr:DUF4124 domain-containing protein [Pseudomonadota bacterium]MCL2309139.1 DUF4124 domain-containing protein [Pseudomonadota bacterium]